MNNGKVIKENRTNKDDDNEGTKENGTNEDVDNKGTKRVYEDDEGEEIVIIRCSK